MASEPPPLVWVEWEDSAQAVAGWEWLDDIKPDGNIVCYSVGFLVADSEKEKRLAISVGSRKGVVDQASGIITIPTSCIVRQGRLTASVLASSSALPLLCPGPASDQSQKCE